MKYSIVIYSVIILFFLQCKPQSAPKKKLNPKVTNAINSVVSKNSLPGLTFSIIYKNGNQENYKAGYSDIENQINLSSNHTFFSGSIGKTYAVSILMPLIESGKIDLKEKFINYFPNTEWLLKLPNINDFTIEMLLQHRSGLPRYVLHPDVWKTLHKEPDKVWSYQERLSVIFNTKPLHAAGNGFAYSDTNYILLGMLIEKISAKNYYELVKSELIEKYQLKHTYPSLSRNIPNLAVGYSNMPQAFHIPNKTVINGKYCFNPQLEWTGGGMASTTSDLVKWAKIYYEAKAFSKASLQAIVTINPNGKNAEGTNSYGMGSFIFDTNHGIAYGHSGFMPGFNSLFIYYPQLEVAAAIQANCDYASSTINLNELMDNLITLSIAN